MKVPAPVVCARLLAIRSFKKPGECVHNHRRGRVPVCAVMLVAASLWTFGVCAGDFPVKSLRIVVGFSAGSATDLVARMLAQELTRHAGQPVLVENRTGASGTIATERVAASAADGCTLLLMVAADTVHPAMRGRLPYDLERDFAPVSLLVTGPLVLAVHPSLPARNVKELLALALSSPGKMRFGSSGAGSRAHFAGELLQMMGKVNLVHVPYKGSTDTVLATSSGQIEVCFPSVTALLPFLDAGKLAALAVTAAKRASSLPGLPTLHESGLPGYDIVSWYGVSAPAGVPKDVITRLNALVIRSLSNRDMIAAFDKQGLEVQTNSPAQFSAFIGNEMRQNAKLVKLAGLKSDH